MATTYGVEFGTLTEQGGDYEIEQCASAEAALARCAEMRKNGCGDEHGEPGARYAIAVELDSSGCPRRTISDDVGVALHARSADGRHEATQLISGRWVAGRAYGDCQRCTSRGIAASGHIVDDSTPTYATALEALDVAQAEFDAS